MSVEKLPAAERAYVDRMGKALSGGLPLSDT